MQHSRFVVAAPSARCRARLLLSAGGPLDGAGRAPAQPAAQDARPQFPRVQLTAGRSTVSTTDFDVTRIAITNPAIADAVVVAPREILIDGKAPGTVSLIVWGNGVAHAVRPGRRAAGDDARAAPAHCSSPAKTSR